MRARKHGTPACVACLAIWSALAGGCTHDRILLNNAGGSKTGAFVDGKRGAGVLENRSYRSGGNVITLPELKRRSSNDEVIAFTNSRPPISGPVNWDPPEYTLGLTFPSEIELPVTVWILGGNPIARYLKALDDLLTTNSIFRKERMGVRLRLCGFKMRAAQMPVYDGSMAQTLHDDVGFVPGHLNVYYVRQVRISEKDKDGNWHTSTGPGNGQTSVVSDDGKFARIVVLGSDPVPELLAHEIGHVFNIEHTNKPNLPNDFGPENVMDSASDVREFFTEGQTYRCHFHKASDLNSYYQARGPDTPARPRRTIHEWLGNDANPALNRRIWPDGARPSN